MTNLGSILLDTEIESGKYQKQKSLQLAALLDDDLEYVKIQNSKLTSAPFFVASSSGSNDGHLKPSTSVLQNLLQTQTSQQEDLLTQKSKELPAIIEKLQQNNASLKESKEYVYKVLNGNYEKRKSVTQLPSSSLRDSPSRASSPAVLSTSPIPRTPSRKTSRSNSIKDLVTTPPMTPPAGSQSPTPRRNSLLSFGELHERLITYLSSPSKLSPTTSKKHDRPQSLPTNLSMNELDFKIVASNLKELVLEQNVLKKDIFLSEEQLQRLLAEGENILHVETLHAACYRDNQIIITLLKIFTKSCAHHPKFKHSLMASKFASYLSNLLVSKSFTFGSLSVPYMISQLYATISEDLSLACLFSKNHILAILNALDDFVQMFVRLPSIDDSMKAVFSSPSVTTVLSHLTAENLLDTPTPSNDITSEPNPEVHNVIQHSMLLQIILALSQVLRNLTRQKTSLVQASTSSAPVSVVFENNTSNQTLQSTVVAYFEEFSLLMPNLLKRLLMTSSVEGIQLNAAAIIYEHASIFKEPFEKLNVAEILATSLGWNGSNTSQNFELMDKCAQALLKMIKLDYNNLEKPLRRAVKTLIYKNILLIHQTSDITADGDKTGNAHAQVFDMSVDILIALMQASEVALSKASKIIQPVLNTKSLSSKASFQDFRSTILAPGNHESIHRILAEYSCLLTSSKNSKHPESEQSILNPKK